MTAPENFVSRWARLKRNSAPRRTTEGVTDTALLSTSDVSEDSTEAAISQPQSEVATTDELFDPAGLPSIEAITIDTDIRGFLRRGVPAELARAALRQAWASDPAIRDFIGIAENQWDFNDPNAIPGFGPSLDQEGAPALLAQALGRHDNFAAMISEMPLAGEPSLPAAIHPEPAALDQSAQLTFDVSPSGEGTAAGNDPVAEGDKSRQNRRSHGSALPR